MLTCFSKFHEYSYQNSLLIKIQKPDATYVAGYRQWQDKFNRHVKKGEKGIAILAPFTYTTKETKEDGDTVKKEEVTKTYFKPVYVFDISQTEGEKLPAMEININDDFSELLKPLLDFSDLKGIEVNFKSLPENQNGYYSDGEIVIKETLHDTRKAAVLLHELAHAILHAQGESNDLTQEIREMEAEAVAFVVANHYELDIDSEKYLALYKESYDLKESLKRINSAADEILEFLKERITEEAVTC